MAVDYRAFVLGKTGHILARHDFKSPDDASALEHARQYVITSTVEVWQEGRLVGTLRPDSAA
jgi:hypothetical protein